MAYATKLSRPLLGPFWQPYTREEIIPATTAATDRVVEMALGTYRAQSALPSAPMISVAITPRILTAFIPRDLDRVFSGQPPGKGFLIDYRGSGAAVGRMVEELIATMLMRRIKWRGEKATSVRSVLEAQELGWIIRPRYGVRSDDLVARTKGGHLWLAEVKGSLRGSDYLVTSRPKAVAQMISTLRANRHVRAGYLIGVVMPEKIVRIEGKTREHWLIS